MSAVVPVTDILTNAGGAVCWEVGLNNDGPLGVAVGSTPTSSPRI